MWFQPLTSPGEVFTLSGTMSGCSSQGVRQPTDRVFDLALNAANDHGIGAIRKQLLQSGAPTEDRSIAALCCDDGAYLVVPLLVGLCPSTTIEPAHHLVGLVHQEPLHKVRAGLGRALLKTGQFSRVGEHLGQDDVVSTPQIAGDHAECGWSDQRTRAGEVLRPSTDHGSQCVDVAVEDPRVLADVPTRNR